MKSKTWPVTWAVVVLSMYQSPLHGDQPEIVIESGGLSVGSPVQIQDFWETTRDENRVEDVSDIAWDNDEGLLYAVSDRGVLYTLLPDIVDNIVKGVSLISRTSLKDRSGDPLSGKLDDAEGMDTLRSNNGVAGDTRLIVSFERVPRVTLFNVDGTFVEQVEPGSRLYDISNYRKPNKSLEAVVHHDSFGPLIAPEKSFSHFPARLHSIFSVDGKHAWHFIPGLQGDSSLSSMEQMGDAGVLVLERDFDKPSGYRYTGLTFVDITNCVKVVCDSTLIKKLSEDDGVNAASYEGLTRVNDNLFLMVNDNSNNPEIPSSIVALTLGISSD